MILVVQCQVEVTMQFIFIMIINVYLGQSLYLSPYTFEYWTIIGVLNLSSLSLWKSKYNLSAVEWDSPIIDETRMILDVAEIQHSPLHSGWYS